MVEKIIDEANAAVGVCQCRTALAKDGATVQIPFTITRVIARGSFGVVSKISQDGVVRAMKTVYQDNRYCNREIDILLDIEHPSVIQLHSYFYTHETRSGHFLNMVIEYVPVVLEDVLKGERVTSAHARAMMRELLEGLRYLHGLGIAHRDIKPANILLDSEKRVRICDFGSAKHMREGELNVPYICSRYYRAPENLARWNAYGTKIDVWAAGAIFCEFRTPGPVFVGANSEEVLRSVLSICDVSDDFLKLLKRSSTPAFVECACKARAVGIDRFLRDYFDDDKIIEVIAAAVTVDIDQRATANALLQMPFFTTDEHN